MNHVTLFSAGGGSWKTAKIVQREKAPEDVHLLVFTDTLYEDADAYRFLLEGAFNVFGRRPQGVPRLADFPDYRVADDTSLEDYAGNPQWRAFLAQLRQAAAIHIPELVWLVEGRDPIEIFRDERFLGNSSVDPCSKKLKRWLTADWREANCDRSDTTFYVGIGEHESHRYDDGEDGGIRPRMAKEGWNYKAPLVGTIEGLINPTVPMRTEGIKPPRLYGMGYTHNNCGGFCCKAGMAHNAMRYRVQPERAAYDAMWERKFRVLLGDVAMMTDRVGGDKRPLPLDEFHARLARSPELDFAYDQDSGCGCAIDA